MSAARRVYHPHYSAYHTESDVPAGDVMWAGPNNAGFVIQPNASGQPSYGFRTRPGAPYAQGNEPPTLSGPNGGPMTNDQWSATFHNNLQDVIQQGEAYHAQNGIPLPNMNTYQSGGTTFGQPSGQAEKIRQSYGDLTQPAFTQFGPSTLAPAPNAQVTQRLQKMNSPEPLI